MYTSREPAIKVKDREQPTVFYNFSDEVFEGTWNFSENNKIWKLKPDTSYKLPFYLAEHFAHKLVDRELLRQDKPVDHADRQELLNKCVDFEKQDEPADPAEAQYVDVQEVPLNRDVRGYQMEKEHGVTGQAGYDKEAVEKSMEQDEPQPEREFEGLEDQDEEEE